MTYINAFLNFYDGAKIMKSFGWYMNDFVDCWIARVLCLSTIIEAGFIIHKIDMNISIKLPNIKLDVLVFVENYGINARICIYLFMFLGKIDTI